MHSLSDPQTGSSQKGKHTRHDIAVNVFHAAVSVADFQRTSLLWSGLQIAPGITLKTTTHARPERGIEKIRHPYGYTSPLS
jgi:hypothetical protein